MRGKAQKNLPTHDMHGITPAYAGKSPFDCVKMSLSQDHPRLCGEKSVRNNEK